MLDRSCVNVICAEVPLLMRLSRTCSGKLSAKEWAKELTIDNASYVAEADCSIRWNPMSTMAHAYDRSAGTKYNQDFGCINCMPKGLKNWSAMSRIEWIFRSATDAD